MKKFTIFALLALIPLFGFSAESRNDNVYGYWEDYYSGVSLKIKPARRNAILVKRLDKSRRSNWVKYDRIARGVFDDCNGNVLRFSRRGLKWSKKRGRKIFRLEKVYDERRGYDNRRGYNGRRGNDRYNDGRRSDYYDYRPRRGTVTSYNLGGDWYCSDHDLYIDVDYYDDGIRVKRRGRNNEWYNYKRDGRDSSRYRGKNNSYYEYDNGRLRFHDKKGKKITFRRR